MLVTRVLYDPLMLYAISNDPVYGLCICVCDLCICVCLIVWNMCSTISGVVILKSYMFLCFILCYMMCFIIFHLCFQFYMYKVSAEVVL
jgi:hypothetical protein